MLKSFVYICADEEDNHHIIGYCNVDFILGIDIPTVVLHPIHRRDARGAVWRGGEA